MGVRSGSNPRFGDAFGALLAAAQAGAPWAWDRLYGYLAPAVAGYLRLQGARDADDLTSEVFIGVYRGISSFSGSEAQFRSWVFVIAHRRVQDARRHAARVPELLASAALEDLPRAAGDVEADVEGELGRQRVFALCACLAPDQRDVLLLRVVADLTVEQVAETLGKSPGAVKALQRRGLEGIRRMLRQGVTL
ncbi:MAG: sigma-70 family RNA polymerase sigma factor [Acidimicrobiia bacterium]|nr:sigma-70 family RNA polymerase sigma factor [Acidimicrobiia bacterium]